MGSTSFSTCRCSVKLVAGLRALVEDDRFTATRAPLAQEVDVGGRVRGRERLSVEVDGAPVAGREQRDRAAPVGQLQAPAPDEVRHRRGAEPHLRRDVAGAKDVEAGCGHLDAHARAGHDRAACGPRPQRRTAPAPPDTPARCGPDYRPGRYRKGYGVAAAASRAGVTRKGPYHWTTSPRQISLRR